MPVYDHSPTRSNNCTYNFTITVQYVLPETTHIIIYFLKTHRSLDRNTKIVSVHGSVYRIGITNHAVLFISDTSTSSIRTYHNKNQHQCQ